mgnify:FL=1
MPEVAKVPDHPPEAIQDEASVEDQLNVDDCPLVIEEGEAESVTVGAGVGGGGLTVLPPTL